MKLTALLSEIRYHLNDEEALGFTDGLLTEFIYDGLCMIYQLSPDDFTERRVIQATTGSVQCATCCSRILSVDGQSDACGNILKGVKQGKVADAARFGKKNVPKRGRYTVEVKKNSQNSFDVYPAILPDETVYFLLTCANPPVIEEGEIPDCKYHQALLHYVLYRAYSVESESATSRSIADQEYRYFYELMGITRKLAQEVVKDAEST